MDTIFGAMFDSASDLGPQIHKYHYTTVGISHNIQCKC